MTERKKERKAPKTTLDPNLLVVFDETGKLISYPKVELTDEEKAICIREGIFFKEYVFPRYHDEPERKTYMWRTNAPFKATLTVADNHYSSDYSAKDAIWIDLANQKKYNMFMKDVMDLIRADQGKHVLKGTFIIVRRGSNYGLRWIGKYTRRVFKSVSPDGYDVVEVDPSNRSMDEFPYTYKVHIEEAEKNWKWACVDNPFPGDNIKSTAAFLCYLQHIVDGNLGRKPIKEIVYDEERKCIKYSVIERKAR